MIQYPRTTPAKSATKLKKTKRAVDTKASKGRKLRFVVQPKLQNFMFPVSGVAPEIDTGEFFNSLFGAWVPSEISHVVAISVSLIVLVRVGQRKWRQGQDIEEASNSDDEDDDEEEEDDE